MGPDTKSATYCYPQRLWFFFKYIAIFHMPKWMPCFHLTLLCQISRQSSYAVIIPPIERPSQNQKKSWQTASLFEPPCCNDNILPFFESVRSGFSPVLLHQSGWRSPNVRGLPSSSKPRYQIEALQQASPDNAGNLCDIHDSTIFIPEMWRKMKSGIPVFQQRCYSRFTKMMMLPVTRLLFT